MKPRKEVVLVIDDMRTFREMISHKIRQRGYKVVTASSMENALDLFTHSKVDVVITDIFMPGMGGLAGISILRQKWEDVFVIAISGGSGAGAAHDVLRTARQIGADAVMRKPFEMDVLADKVDKFVASGVRRKRRKRVLVAEDSETIRNMVIWALKKFEHEPFAFDNMEDAIASPEVAGVDLVVTDIFMPGKGGLALIKEIRDNWPDVPVIAMSGGFDTMQGAKALEAARRCGATSTISKPFKLDYFAQEVERVMELGVQHGG